MARPNRSPLSMTGWPAYLGKLSTPDRYTVMPERILIQQIPLCLRALTACLLISVAVPFPAHGNTLQQAQKAVRMQDFDKALGIYRVLAEQGDPRAQYQLASFYLRGLAGPKNEQSAQAWLEKAAEAKQPDAQYALAQLIRNKQPTRAQELLQASAAQGHRAAKLLMERGTPAPTESDADRFDDRWFGAARNNDLKTLQSLNRVKPAISMTDKHGRSALFYAIESDARAAAEWLLQQGSDVNHSDNYGLTPLHVAVERGNRALVTLLLEQGGDASVRLADGDSLLHYALRKELYSLIPTLLSAGTPINTLNERGWTALDLAEYKNANRTVQLLKSKGAKKGETWRQKPVYQDVGQLAQQLNNTTLPPVALAVINNNVKLLNNLVNKDKNVLNTTLNDDNPLLILAVRQGNPKMVQALLDHGANVRQTGYQGATALHSATAKGDLQSLKILLGAGASPIQQDASKRDSIMLAIETGQVEIAQALLDNLIGKRHSNSEARVHLKSIGAPVNHYIMRATRFSVEPVIDRLLPYATKEQATDEQGRTALWFAAHAKDAKLILKLLKADLAADQPDNLGRTPFYVAVDHGCFECARQLVGFADINHQTTSGNTALMRAAANGDAKMVSWLIRNNADVNIRNQRGNTALMEAVNSHDMASVKHLLVAKASPTRKNKLGFSAIDLAQQVSPQMLELVESKSVLGIF